MWRGKLRHKILAGSSLSKKNKTWRLEPEPGRLREVPELQKLRQDYSYSTSYNKG